MNLIILGPQGSGKGTQAKLLKENLGLFYLEVGEILRKKAQENTLLGQKIDKLLNKGLLIPQWIIRKILLSSLSKKNLKQGIIFDGSPRTLSQAEFLDRQLTRRKSSIQKVIFLRIPKEISIARLSSRRICPKCKKIYNLITLPPKKEGICDACHVKLVIRADETPEAIEKRLQLYRQKTTPLLKYYREKGILLEIDGILPIKKVYQQILKNLVLK